MGPLDKEILKTAADNDGLWEFAYIGGLVERVVDTPNLERVSPNPEAFRDLHQAMIALLKSGYIAIRTQPFREDMNVEEAVAVLMDAETWVLPWESGGAPETRSDAYWVRLTPIGEAALSS
jgi:predicted exporter